jgi:hypothetical protein
MSTWPTDAVYIAKYNPNTGYFNDFFDRNDDLLRLPAIQIAEPGTNDPNRDYLAVVEGSSGNKNIVFRLYQNGRFELSDGSGFNSVVDSSGDFTNLTDDQLLTAQAVLDLVNSSIATNDVIDQIARDAVYSALSTITTNISARIDSEITRATTAESLLQGDIDQLEEDLASEISRATAAEASLQAGLDAVPGLIQTAVANNDVIDSAARDAVQSALEQADSATNTALTAEISRATAAEQSLDVALQNEIARASAAEQANAAAIAAEATARVAALDGIDLSGIATNSAAIADEVTRATAAEQANSNSLAAEILARTVAVANENARATAAEQANASAIAAETTRATAAEQANAAAISAETTRATSAEADLQSSIDSNTALIQQLEGGADIAQVSINTQAIANEISARTASDLALQADILSLEGEFDTLLSSSIPASYLLKIDGNDVVISTDGVSTGTDDPDPSNLTAIQELYAQINNLITQALPSSSMFRAVGTDFVVSGFLTGHAGGSLIEFSTGDIILPTEPTGFPESSFRLSDDYSEIIFGE